MALERHLFVLGSAAAGLMVMAAGLGLLSLALPRLVGAVAATGGEPAIERLREGGTIGGLAIERARRAFAAAQRVMPRDYRQPRDLGLIELVAAELAEPGSAARKAALGEALRLNREALASNPAQPYVWLRLAQAELMAKGVGSEAAGAFAMSFKTGTQIVDLMQPRVSLGLTLWPALQAPERQRVLAQIRGLARFNARLLAETVLERPGLAQVRAALEDEPKLLAAFLEIYLQRKTPGYRPPL